MMTNFERDKKKFINRLWNFIPSKLRPIVLLVALGGGIWGAVKFVPDMVEWFKSLQAGRVDETAKMTAQDEKTKRFIAHQIWAETQGNLKTLERWLEEREKFGIWKKPVHFTYEVYDRYNGQLDTKTSDQITHFFKNLKRIENNEPYARDDILKIIGQGQDVLNFLHQDFGLQDYFMGNKPSNIVSADTHIAGGSIVSAGLPVLTKPPYGSVGEILPEKENAKSD